MLRFSLPVFTAGLLLAHATTAFAADPDAPDDGNESATATPTNESAPVMQPMGSSSSGGAATATAGSPATTAPAATPTTTPVTAIAAEEEHPAPNTIFVEGLGAGLFYSVNYERLLFDQLGVRVGLSYMSYGASTTVGTDASSNVSYFTVPLTAEYLGLRAGSHVLEIGAGATMVFSDGSASAGGLTSTGSGVNALGNVHVGYRIHPMGGGFNFRVGAAALYGPGISLSNPDPNSWGIIPWFYISAGASF
jgi:hypothetical protein